MSIYNNSMEKRLVAKNLLQIAKSFLNYFKDLKQASLLRNQSLTLWINNAFKTVKTLVVSI